MESFLAITDYNWVLPLTVCQFLLAWQSASVGKKRKRVWLAAPLCLFWTLWNERNKAAFENETPSVLRMKLLFCSPCGRGLSCIVLMT